MCIGFNRVEAASLALNHARKAAGMPLLLFVFLCSAAARNKP
jgi:hypothetical protein